MNWRRGFVFASIHFTICFGLVVWQESGYWDHLDSSGPVRPQYADVALDMDQLTMKEEPVTVTFDCRNLWYHMPLQQRIINIFELPAALLVGWDEPCPAHWTLVTILGINTGHHTRSKEITSASMLLLLIALQWLFVGAFPLNRPPTWYLEPGASITVCLVFISLVAIFEAMLETLQFRWIEGAILVPGMLGLLSMALGLLAWLWWFFLLLWKPVHLAWQSTLHRLRRLS